MSRGGIPSDLWIDRLALGALQEAGKLDEAVEVTQAKCQDSDHVARLRVEERGQVPDPL